MMDVGLLTGPERGWVDDYHAKVLAIVGPQLDGEAKAWLAEVCAPLG
jgi:Xaa-Pro aminopeptidase